MANTVIIDDGWDAEVRKQAVRFNRYAEKRSMSVVSEAMTRLAQIMENGAGKQRSDAADALRRIANANPSFVSAGTRGKIEAALSSLGVEHAMPEPSAMPTYSESPRGPVRSRARSQAVGAGDDFDVWLQRNPVQPAATVPSPLRPVGVVVDEVEAIGVGPTPVSPPAAPAPKAGMTASDWLQGGSNPFMASPPQTLNPDGTIKRHPTLPVHSLGGAGAQVAPPISLPEMTGNAASLFFQGPPGAGSPPAPRSGTNPGASASPQYEEWSEDDAGEDDPALELMGKTVEQLKVKHIQRVDLTPELRGRKCAMGDGTFEDYDGPLYQCECGTLYHETCLKMQAIYAGQCQICDRPYLKLA
jgi:hypothetical protein